MQYFDDETAFLTQSGQLYNEANAMALGRVYCFGPTFRAEKSKTRRHLTEFWMVEPEMAYADLDDVIDSGGRRWSSPWSAACSRTAPAELKVLERDTTKLERVKAPFPRVSYDEAAKILKEKGLPFEWGGDFGAPDETALSEHFDRPVCVHRYPSAIKAFYMKPDPDGPKSRCASTCSRRKATAKSSAAAHVRRLRPAARAHRGAQAAAGSVRVVSGSAALRQRAARRLRHGHRARGELDLRPRTPAGSDSVSEDAL